LYDIGFPLPRSWLLGIAGFIVVIAAFAIGYVIAGRDPPQTAEVDEPAAIVADNPVDDVLVARAVAEPPKHFPAFAPEGVIVVSAPSQERAFAEIEQPSRRVESAQRRVRSSEPRPPVTVAQTDPRAQELAEPSEEARPETSADERPARNEAPPVREDAEAGHAAEGNNRSWYGSEEYWREVRERRRAEREAQRRQ
jgi:hypothetical protein